MPLHRKPVIIPIASGKGGVGKSVFAANLAISLAHGGHKTVAVDLDLGGSNLHTYLGIANTHPGVGDYLKQKLADLHGLIIDTSVKNLRFLPGDGKTPFMANIPTKQRFSLLESIQNIDAKYVIVDLGAGTSINTMNFFGLANNGIMVTTLDTPALMNALVFLRNFTFANVVSLCHGNRPVQKMLLSTYRQPADKENLTIETILEKIRGMDKRLGDKISQRLRFFKPRFVFNMGDQPEDLKVAPRIAATLKKSLDMECEVIGFIYYDDKVRKAVRKNQVFLPAHPKSQYASCLKDIVGRVTALSSGKFSLQHLMTEAKRHQ